MKYIKHSVNFIIIYYLLFSVARAELAFECGSLENGYGPFDYTNYNNFTERLPIVERAHFTTNVETLQRGNNAPNPGRDLDYTLRAFPNHHRALLAVTRYGVKQDSPQPAGLRYSIECYFKRAILFQPNDENVRVIYGIYLSKTGKKSKATDELKRALELNPDSIEAHYNLGLIYTSLKNYEAALHHAQIAYSNGYPLPGLRMKLEKAGVW